MPTSQQLAEVERSHSHEHVLTREGDHKKGTISTAAHTPPRGSDEKDSRSNGTSGSGRRHSTHALSGDVTKGSSSDADTSPHPHRRLHLGRLMRSSSNGNLSSSSKKGKDVAAEQPPEKQQSGLFHPLRRRLSKSDVRELQDVPAPPLISQTSSEPTHPSKSCLERSDFACEELTPQCEGDEMRGTKDCVQYGAFIRLWVRNDVGGSAGYLSFAARDPRRINGELPGTRFNVGLNDTFLVVPPFRANHGWFFKEAAYKVEDPRGLMHDGTVVKYGDEVLLVDEEESVMCHFRGRKYIRRKQRGTKGEMTVMFLPEDEVDMGREVCYGDSDIRLRLCVRKLLKTEPTLLSALRHNAVDAVGGFLNCVGNGKVLHFGIDHAPPRIMDVSIASTLACGQKQYTSTHVHHNVNWGEYVSFSVPSCQGHTEKNHDGCMIRVALSTGARLKMRQEHNGVIREDERIREVWMSCKGALGEPLELFMRLIHLETVKDDPRRHFVPSTKTKVRPRQQFLQRIPVDLYMFFVVITLVLSPQMEDRLNYMLQSLRPLGLALLACLVWRWVRHWMEHLFPSLGVTTDELADELPKSLLFDTWRLVIVDWRVPSDEVVPIPETFIMAENGDIEKARLRWEKTQQWRKENDVDMVLTKAHPKFRVIKTFYPQRFHFRDREGHTVFWEILGKLDVGELVKHNVNIDDLTRHCILHQEYLWKVLQPMQSDRVLLVIDLKGLTLGDVNQQVTNFAKTAIGLTSTHYPARSFRMLILNVPGWFNMIFGLIKPMLNETMRKKMVFLDAASVEEGLREYIHEDFIPQEYGGKCPVALGESPEEKRLLEIVEAALEEHDVDMEEV